MKLSEITKKDFLNRLRNPHNVLIRRKIKEFRKLIKPKGWGLTSHYYKDSNIFILNISSRANKLTVHPIPHNVSTQSIYYDGIVTDMLNSFPENVDITIEYLTEYDIRISIGGIPI